MDATISHMWRVVATFFGICLAACEVWLNATFQANGGSFGQPQVIATIMITLAGVAAIPIAERAWESGSKWKAGALLFLFFPIVMALSFTSSLDRVGSHRDNKSAEQRSSAKKENLAQTLYDEAVAVKTRDCEGKKDGSPACKKAEGEVRKAGQALETSITTAAQNFEDGMATRIAGILSFLGVNAEWVHMYVPLLMPTGLSVGGVLLLAIGLSPMPGVPLRGEPEPSGEAPRLTPRGLALHRLVELVTKAGPKGYRFRSKRSLAFAIGAAPASFNLWLAEWERDKFDLSRDGKFYVLRLSKIRVVA